MHEYVYNSAKIGSTTFFRLVFTNVTKAAIKMPQTTSKL